MFGLGFWKNLASLGIELEVQGLVFDFEQGKVVLHFSMFPNRRILMIEYLYSASELIFEIVRTIYLL